jgi:hypothetical protein
MRSRRRDDEDDAIMVWPYLLTRRDLVGAACALALLAVIIFASFVRPMGLAKTNYGFGPEWDCVYPGQGGAVCIKHAPPARE